MSDEQKIKAFLDTHYPNIEYDVLILPKVDILNKYQKHPIACINSKDLYENGVLSFEKVKQFISVDIEHFLSFSVRTIIMPHKMVMSLIAMNKDVLYNRECDKYVIFGYPVFLKEDIESL